MVISKHTINGREEMELDLSGRKVALVEQWIDDEIIPKEFVVIAISAGAAFELEAAGIEPLLLEDFYTSFQVRGDIDSFLLDQVKWFEELDSALGKMFPESRSINLKIGTEFFAPLKYMIDNAILSEIILRNFLNKCSPAEIWYLANADPESEHGFENLADHPFFPNLDQDFSFGSSLFSQLISDICAEQGVLCRVLSTESSRLSAPASASKNIQVTQSRQKLTFDTLSERIRHSIRLFQIGFRNLSPYSSKGGVLVVHSSKRLIEAILIASKIGFWIGKLEDDGIRMLGIPGYTRGRRVQISRNDNQAEPAGEKLRELYQSSAFAQLEERYGPWIGKLLKRRMKFFVEHICPRFISLTSEYEAVLKEQGIQLVLVANVSDVHERAAIAASKRSREITVIGFGHGSDLYECKSRFFYLTRYFDQFITPTKGEALNEEKLRIRFGYKHPKIFSSPIIYNELLTHRQKQDNTWRTNGKRSRETVLFVPIIYGAVPGRSFQKNQPFPLEYFRWHKALIHFFEKKEGLDVIWKSVSDREPFHGEIQRLVSEGKIQNISPQSGPLRNFLVPGTRVLLDIPSTAFFETIAAGLPSLAFFRPRYQILREFEESDFGLSIQKWDSIEEGLAKIDEFLGVADSSLYISELFENEATKSLEGIKKLFTGECVFKRST